MSDDRLARQLRFLLELDALKGVERRSWLLGGARRENSAEHSWHVALFGWLLAEHADEPLDRERVLRLLLVHDVVEIDAGDTFRYDDDGHADKLERERAAAERLFGLLPDDQGAELRALWDEFEARESADSRFANALDRLQPTLNNLATGGGSWRRHAVVKSQVMKRLRPIGDGSPMLWEHVKGLLDQAVADGILDEG